MKTLKQILIRIELNFCKRKNVLSAVTLALNDVCHILGQVLPESSADGFVIVILLQLTRKLKKSHKCQD